ncbi:MAG: hypothetical protein QXG10_04330 [Candidatus Hadarchaeales archaeon]
MLTTILIMIPAIFLLGPGGGAVIALSKGIPPAETMLLVSAIHAGLVPVWFGIFELIHYTLRYNKRIIDMISRRVKIGRKITKNANSNIQEFERRVGQWGLGLGTVAFTFVFGISWAALIAYMMNIKERTIFLSVTAGAIASAIFWTAVYSGLTWLVPNIWMVYVAGLIMALGVMTYNSGKERRVVEEMAKSLDKIIGHGRKST